MRMSSKKLSIVLFLTAAAALVGYFLFLKNEPENFVTSGKTAQTAQIAENTQSGGYKTFVFDNFHGSTDISDKFEFQYPANWFNESQYFSPQRIQYYTKYEVKAPIWFDLVLAEIFNFTELKYQIDNSKRRAADTVGKIDGKEFRRYDLIDYGTYGGESAGRVKIFVGPKIKIDGQDYVLVFHWEERPLAEYMPDNSVEVFDDMLLTLKFFH
ncbi:MAG: hypothetical protein Q8P35_00335 [Candidatus Yanofskybacteria bacterium]|nr:hypothetical protein [Candidatus Yanofskybacteria bacterium]